MALLHNIIRWKCRSDWSTDNEHVSCVYSGADAFPAECSALMEQMVQGKMLQAQVVGHEADGVPYIQLYDIQGDQVPASIIYMRHYHLL